MMDSYDLAQYALRQLDTFFDRFDLSAMSTGSSIMFNDLRRQYTDMVLRLAAASNSPHEVIDRLVEYLWEADAVLNAEGQDCYNLRLLFSTIADRLLAEVPDDEMYDLVLFEPTLPSLN